MRYCEKCGKEIPKDALYCPYCKNAVHKDKTAILKVIVAIVVGAVILFGVCKGCNLSSYPIFTTSINEVSNEST